MFTTSLNCLRFIVLLAISVKGEKSFATVPGQRLCQLPVTDLAANGYYNAVFMESSDLGGPCHLDDFQLGKVLGSGNFGIVREALHRPTGTKVAIKFQQNDTNEWFLFHRNEECIHNSLNFPTIPKLFCTIVVEKVVAHVMELVEGINLGQAVKEKALSTFDFGQLDIKKLMAQLSITIDYLHSKNVVMADLKADNIMITRESGDLRLIDFGLGIKTLSDGRVFKKPEWVSNHVIPEYGNNPAVDWYSYGLVLYEILNGEGPFEQLKGPNLFKSPLLRGKFCPDSFEALVCDFIKHFSRISVDTKLRPKEGEIRRVIRSHPWFEGFNWDPIDAIARCNILDI